MFTIVHGITSDEPLTSFLPWTMRSRQGILCNLGWFLSIFGCRGNSLGSLKISDSIFKFAVPNNLTVPVKKSSIFCAELKSLQFLLILPKFGCHDNSLGSLENSDSIFEIDGPENPRHTCKNCLDNLYINKVRPMPIWMFEVSLPLWYRQFSIFFCEKSGHFLNILIKS